MDKELLKQAIIDLFKSGELYLGVETNKDIAYSNRNDGTKINTVVKLLDEYNNVITETSDYVLID